MSTEELPPFGCYRLPLFLFTLTYLFIWKILKEFNRRPEKIWVTNLISDQTCSHLALLNKSFMLYYFVMVKITIELLEINITSDFFQWDICVQSVRIIGEMCDLWLNIEVFCKVTVTFNLRSPNTNQYLQSKVLRWCAAMIVAVTNHWSMSRHSMRSQVSDDLASHCTQLWVICSKSLQEHPFLCISASVPLGLSSFLLNLLYPINYDFKKSKGPATCNPNTERPAGSNPEPSWCEALTNTWL